MGEKVNLAAKFSQVEGPWRPAIVGELNDQYVKVARFEGDYVWHCHEQEDELFFVVDGQVRIELRDRTVELHPGEFFIVPRGVEHRPASDNGANVLLFEPATTRSTGNTESLHTIEATDLPRL